MRRHKLYCTRARLMGSRTRQSSGPRHAPKSGDFGCKASFLAAKSIYRQTPFYIAKRHFISPTAFSLCQLALVGTVFLPILTNRTSARPPPTPRAHLAGKGRSIWQSPELGEIIQIASQVPSLNQRTMNSEPAQVSRGSLVAAVRVATNPQDFPGFRPM